MRQIEVLWVVIFLTACSSDAPISGIISDPCQPIVLVPGTDTSAAELESVVAAMDSWEQRAVSPFTLDEAPGAPRISVTFEDAPLLFHGFYDSATGEVFINRGMVDAHERAVTIAHELGHAMGLPHTSDFPSVMRKANLDVEPTAEDAAALQAMWGGCVGRE